MAVGYTEEKRFNDNKEKTSYIAKNVLYKYLLIINVP